MNFFLLKLPLLSFVFNHHGHFEVSNTIKEDSSGEPGLLFVVFFKAGEIAVGRPEGDFPGEGLWSWASLFTGMLRAPRGVCGADRVASGCARCRFPPSWGRFTPRHRRQLPHVCSGSDQRCLQASVWSKRGFFQAAPGSLFK